MKRAILTTVILVLLLLPATPTGWAQDGGAEQIDDQTPSPAQTAGKVDPSDEQHIPESYMVVTGGPDRFGYTYADSNGGACAFRWVADGIPGLQLDLGDDGTARIPIGYSFPFYGREYTHLVVDSNGALLLEERPSDWVNVPLGSPGPTPRLAPFWDDLLVDSVQVQSLGQAPHRTLAVTFRARRAEGGQLEFQALLAEDGRIRFQYRSLSGAWSEGTGATVGIQGPDTGLGYLFNGYPRENLLHEGLAICFAPPDGVYLSPGFQRGYAVSAESIGYGVTAINQTGAEGNFDFVVESPWPATVTPQRATILDGGTLALQVTVEVPQGAVGERVEVLVHMASATAGQPAMRTTARLEAARASGDYGYTGASTTDDVAVFDLQTWTRIDSLDLLPEGNYPYDATMVPDGSEVWIPGASGDGLVVIDTAINTITQRISVGEYPVSVAFSLDSAYAFVANRDTEDVSLVDAGSYAVVDTIPIPTYYLGAGNLALDPDSGDIYLVDWYGDYLFVLDTDTMTVTHELLLGNSLWQLVANPLGGLLYVTDRGTDVVRVVDTVTLSEITTVPVGDDPWGIDITPDGSLIYVTNEDSHNVTAIDATDNSVITTISLPHPDAGPRDVDFSADGAYAYVTSGGISGDDQVYVIDTATHTVAGQVNVAPSSNPNVVAVAPQMAASLDLLASKRATPEPVVLGDPLTYTISFAYTGLVSATNVLVTDTLPVGTAYLTSSGGLTSTYDAGNHRLIWELGDIDANTMGQLEALVQPVDEALPGQAIVNEAYLDFTSFANFSATVWATSTVVAPQLSIYVDGNEPPDPLALCEGYTVTLSAESNRPGPLTYAWDLGDGTVADTAEVIHAWTYGDYTVWLTTTNAYGWVETDTLAVAVGHPPVAAFASNSPVLLGQNAVFTDLTTYDPAGWLWDFGDNVGTSTEPGPVYNYSNSGLYTVTLTVSNTCGVDVYVDRFQVLEFQLHYVYLPVILADQP